MNNFKNLIIKEENKLNQLNVNKFLIIYNNFENNNNNENDK